MKEKQAYGDKTTFVFGSSVFGRAGISYDTLAKKVIVVFRNTGTGNGNHGNVIVGTVVGFGITFNTKEKYSEYYSTEWNSTVFDPDSQRPVLVAALMLALLRLLVCLELLLLIQI